MMARLRADALVAAVCAGWFVLFGLTPGLLAEGPGSSVSAERSGRLLVECALAVAIIAALLGGFRREAGAALGRSRLAWAYVLPAALLVALPFHCGTLIADPLPIALYVLWMACSVFYQDVLTFGLLPGLLARSLPRGAAAALTATMFPLGHAVFLPAFLEPVAFAAIVAMGAACVLVRRWGRIAPPRPRAPLRLLPGARVTPAHPSATHTASAAVAPSTTASSPRRTVTSPANSRCSSTVRRVSRRRPRSPR